MVLGVYGIWPQGLLAQNPELNLPQVLRVLLILSKNHSVMIYLTVQFQLVGS